MQRALPCLILAGLLAFVSASEAKGVKAGRFGVSGTESCLVSLTGFSPGGEAQGHSQRVTASFEGIVTFATPASGTPPNSATANLTKILNFDGFPGLSELPRIGSQTYTMPFTYAPAQDGNTLIMSSDAANTTGTFTSGPYNGLVHAYTTQIVLSGRIPKNALSLVFGSTGMGNVETWTIGATTWYAFCHRAGSGFWLSN